MPHDQVCSIRTPEPRSNIVQHEIWGAEDGIRPFGKESRDYHRTEHTTKSPHHHTERERGCRKRPSFATEWQQRNPSDLLRAAVFANSQPKVQDPWGACCVDDKPSYVWVVLFLALVQELVLERRGMWESWGRWVQSFAKCGAGDLLKAVGDVRYGMVRFGMVLRGKKCRYLGF